MEQKYASKLLRYGKLYQSNLWYWIIMRKQMIEYDYTY